MAHITLQITASEISATMVDELMEWCENQTYITIDYGKVVRNGEASAITVMPAYPADVNWQQWQAFCDGFSMHAL